jgi:hypothetical protein
MTKVTKGTVPFGSRSRAKQNRPLCHLLVQESFMGQPQQAEPFFRLLIDLITARVTRAVISMIAMIVAAFIGIGL